MTQIFGSGSDPVSILEDIARCSLENLVQTRFYSLRVSYFLGTDEIIYPKLKFIMMPLLCKFVTEIPGTFSTGNQKLLCIFLIVIIIFVFTDKVRLAFSACQDFERPEFDALFLFAAEACILNSAGLD